MNFIGPFCYTKFCPGYGTGAGLCGWNCRHSFYPFYEGLSKPAYTDEELEKLNEKNIIYNNKAYSKYEASQMQRALERKVRKYKKQYLIEDSAGVDTAVVAVKLKNSRFNLKEFVYATNGRVDNFRTSTAGFGKSQAGKANWTATPFYKFYYENKAKNVNQLLPNRKKADISESKIIGYVLNKNHQKGKDKAIAFENVLGYNVDNAQVLIEEIRKGLEKWKFN